MTIAYCRNDYWNELPIEIQAEICSYLSNRDILALRETCIKTTETVYLMPIFKSIIGKRVPYINCSDTSLQEKMYLDASLKNFSHQKNNLAYTRYLQNNTVEKCQRTMMHSIFSMGLQTAGYALNLGWSSFMASVKFTPSSEQEMKMLQSLMHKFSQVR